MPSYSLNLSIKEAAHVPKESDGLWPDFSFGAWIEIPFLQEPDNSLLTVDSTVSPE